MSQSEYKKNLEKAKKSLTFSFANIILYANMGI